MKIVAAAALLTLTACATVKDPPVAVQIMPMDCANRVAIQNWYQSQLAVPRAAFQNQTDHEARQAEIRYRLWHLRYHCQPV